MTQRRYATDEYIKDLSENELQRVGKMGSNNAANKFKAVRVTLANYFMSPEGQMEHQFDYVKRGTFKKK